MKGYPIELRARVVKAVQEREDSIAAIAKLFQVSESSIYKLLRQLHETGCLAPKPHGGGVAPMLDEPKLEQLRQAVKAQPDATLEELQQRLQRQAHVQPSRPTVCRALQKLGLRRKKKKFFAQERDPKKRQEFLKKARQLDARKLVFIDEMGTNVNLTRTHARAPGSERIEEALPCNTPPTLSVAGALGAEKLLASCALEGAFDAEAFALFIEHMVAPQLQPGDIVLMDNGPAHQSPKVELALQAAGAKLLKLPTYSPDLDAIEPCWSKVKACLRKLKARTSALLHKGLSTAFRLITAEDIRGWFNHCGYHFAPG